MLIKNARIVNADGAVKAAQDILIEDGKIKQIAASIPNGKHEVVDASGKLVLPGLVDIHVHFREPGREDKETIATGSMAAAKGGVTTVMCMPNTSPVIDNAMLVEGIIKEGRRVGLVNIIPVGAITKGQKDEELVDMFELKKAGCLALSDDGKSVNNTNLMRLAMEYSKMVGLLLIEHCQDATAGKGVMNEGFYSTLLGMKGDPGFSETITMARDIELARYLDSRIHFAHISLQRSVELVAWAKSQGIKVTCETCPQYFSLTEETVKSFSPNTKVNPPLRSKADVEAIKQGIKNGIIDCIVTDHAPHTREDKEVGFDAAPFGMIGLETSLALAITELVETKIIDMPKIVELMSFNPARIVGLTRKGAIKEEMDADIVVVDPNAEWTVEEEGFVSKSKNSPFVGRKLKGVVEVTVCGGKVVYKSSE